MATTTKNNEHNILEPERNEADKLAGNDEKCSQPSQEDDNDELFWESLQPCNENTLELASANENQFEGGHLIVWGCGEFGQHGHGHTQDVQSTDALVTPLWYGEDRLVVRVACGSSHTLIITGNTKLLCIDQYINSTSPPIPIPPPIAHSRYLFNSHTQAVGDSTLTSDLK